ncbi:hypothetical protein HDU96_002723 [Phlyctochytrium bullatum]|nr:hypothetical protein HDU96_002723 [Phlyctochytrium bullatum]
MLPGSPSHHPTPPASFDPPRHRRCPICDHRIRDDDAVNADCDHAFHRHCIVTILRHTFPNTPNIDAALQSLGADRICEEFKCPVDTCAQPLTFIRVHQAELTAALVSQVTLRPPELTGVDEQTSQSTRQCFETLQRLRPFSRKQDPDVTAVQGICVLLASLFDSTLYVQLLDGELGKDVFESRAQLAYDQRARTAMKRFHRLVRTHPFLHHFGGGTPRRGVVYEAPWVKDESQLARMASEFLGLAKAFFIQGKMWETGRQDLKRWGDSMCWGRFLSVLQILDIATRTRNGATVPQRTPQDMLRAVKEKVAALAGEYRRQQRKRKRTHAPGPSGSAVHISAEEQRRRDRRVIDAWIQREGIPLLPEVQVQTAGLVDLLEGTEFTWHLMLLKRMMRMQQPGESVTVYIPRDESGVASGSGKVHAPYSPFVVDDSDDDWPDKKKVKVKDEVKEEDDSSEADFSENEGS